MWAAFRTITKPANTQKRSQYLVPFCAGWSDAPHHLVAIAIQRLGHWHDVLKLVQRAMRVNVDLFGICGIVEVAPKGLCEKEASNLAFEYQQGQDPGTHAERAS